MKRIDERTVELTKREEYLSEKFNEELDNGLNIPDALKRVKDAADAAESIGGIGSTDPAFWEWLAH